MIDLTACLAPVSEDNPAGADLQYDPTYLTLFKLAEGKPETQWTPAEEPNWREVSNICVELLTRSKDLRIVSLLTLASLQTSGIVGLAAGLELLKGTLEKYWVTLYPAVDEDDGDPIERTNIIAALSPPPDSYGDLMRFRQRLQEAPLARSPQLGKFGLRQIAIANGAPPVGAETLVEIKTIDAAFADTPLEYLQEIHDAAQRGATAVREIDEFLTSHIGGNKTPDLSEFRQGLNNAVTVTAKFLAKRGVGPGAATAGQSGIAHTSDGPKADPKGRNQMTSGPGEIHSDQDVVAALDTICDYYARNEPSSPVPLLLKRAKKLVSKSFVDILRDLSPDALTRLELIGGPEAVAEPG